MAAADEIDRIEREFVERRRAIVRPLIEAYAEKLKALHDSLMLRADRARAAIVQAERSRILASVENVSATSPLDQPAGPTAGGKCSRDGAGVPPARQRATARRIQKASRRFEQSLRGEGAIAEWKIPKLRPGRYRLTLVYSCDARSGGRCELVIPSLPRIRLSIEPQWRPAASRSR